MRPTDGPQRAGPPCDYELGRDTAPRAADSERGRAGSRDHSGGAPGVSAPVCAQLVCGPADASGDFAAPGPDYRVVRPDHLAAYYRQELARTRLLVRAPSIVAAIAGQRLHFTASLQNVTKQPIEARLNVTAGLDRATVKPESVAPSVPVIPCRLRSRAHLPDSAYSLSCVTPPGRPGRRSRSPAAVGGDSGRHSEGLLAAIRRAVRGGGASAPGRAGRDRPGCTGDRAACLVRKEGSGSAGYVVYGPYAQMGRGRYVALFRLKRTGQGEGPLITLDTCVGGGIPMTAAQRKLTVRGAARRPISRRPARLHPSRRPARNARALVRRRRSLGGQHIPVGDKGLSRARRRHRASPYGLRTQRVPATE